MAGGRRRSAKKPQQGVRTAGRVPGLATFLENLGLERSLIAGVLDGSIIELDADEISHVCERLHCSPFDLWGTELARAALNLYPPERWPRRIEPLDSGRNPPATLPEAKRLLRELVERQALTDLRTSEPYPAQVHEGLLVSGTTTVTGYRRAAILECHPDGHTRRVLGEDAPTSSDAEYHLAFMQVCSPTLVADLPDDDATARGAAGWDVPIQLAVAAQQLRNELADLSPDLRPAEIELVRFTPKAGPEVWLRWDTMTEAWELAHDPRQVYPGPPTDVLNPCGWNEPRPLQELDMPSGQAETPELSDPDLTP